MASQKKLHIGLSLAPTWLSGDAWRRDDSQVTSLYHPSFYLDVSQKAEQAKLDFVFFPDVLHLDPAPLAQSIGFAGIDPQLMMAAIAHGTRHIGLLTTLSTSFYPPYIAARQLQSLNWITQGRIGWNIVTALAGHQNFGLETMPEADRRYEQAAEFVSLVQKLWQSFPDTALMQDRDRGVYADINKIEQINHRGDFFSVQGPLDVPTYGSAKIPFVQAGASPTGRQFAAGLADAIFASTPDSQAAQELRTDLRQRATQQGRSPDDIRLLPGLSLYLADSRSEARDLYLATHARTQKQRKFAHILEMTGLDLSDWPDAKRINASDLPPPPAHPRSRTHSDLLRRLIQRGTMTVAELLQQPEVIGSAHWQIIGTVDDALDQIQSWHAAEAIDGFIALPCGSTNCLDLTVNALVPALSDLGLFRKQYQSHHFWGHLTETA